MKNEEFLSAKPPEYYNRAPEGMTAVFWQSLRQRDAWLLQRWLRGNNGEPFYYFFELKTPVYVLEAKEFEQLFDNPHKYQVRYVGETYWIVWKDQELYFILNVHGFNRTLNVEFPTPASFDLGLCRQTRSAVTSFLTKIQQQEDVEKITWSCGGEVIDTWACTQAIYCEFKDGVENLLFCNYRKNYLIPTQSLVDWHIGFFGS